ncbi:MAG: ATP synthase F1 subunit gamma [bacterium]|nr:ATP synthase F1 subunit gamma [bacterium]
MATLKDIKKRIGSLKNTSQITNAMKMVSAAKLRRAQEAIVAGRPYADKMQSVLSNLSAGVDSSANPLLEVREVEKVGVMLFTSDRGLCGGFNGNLIKKMEKTAVKELAGKEISYSFYGKKGHEYFKRRGVDAVIANKTAVAGSGYDLSLNMSASVIDAYISGEIDELYLIYGKFESAMTQTPVFEKLLPIVPEEKSEETETTDFLFEPDATALLEKLIPKYVASQIYRAVLETAASEHGARMSAMDSASKNAKEMIGDLTVQYNRVRQAAITTELMDIINGAKAV